MNDVGRKDAEGFTILLFNNSLFAGHYLLFRGHEDKLYNSCVQAHYDKTTKVFLGGVATQTPFVTAIINDDAILEIAAKARVVFEDGAEVNEVVSERGLVFIHPGIVDKPMNYLSFTIFDNKGKSIYEKP